MSDAQPISQQHSATPGQLPSVCVLGIMSCGLEYPLGQLESAILAMLPPRSPCSSSLGRACAMFPKLASDLCAFLPLKLLSQWYKTVPPEEQQTLSVGHASSQAINGTSSSMYLWQRVQSTRYPCPCSRLLWESWHTGQGFIQRAGSYWIPAVHRL